MEQKSCNKSSMPILYLFLFSCFWTLGSFCILPKMKCHPITCGSMNVYVRKALPLFNWISFSYPFHHYSIHVMSERYGVTCTMVIRFLRNTKILFQTDIRQCSVANGTLISVLPTVSYTYYHWIQMQILIYGETTIANTSTTKYSSFILRLLPRSRGIVTIAQCCQL